MGLSRSGANFAGSLVAFSPAFAFWSGGFYKEGFILLAAQSKHVSSHSAATDMALEFAC